LIWHDKNVNGIQDDGEPGIEGVVVELYDNVGTLLFTTTTDNAGFYQFINIPNGTYVVILADQNFEDGGVFYNTDHVKWFATRPDQGSDDALDSDGHQYDYSVTVTLNCADDPTIDFGFFKACLTFKKTGPVSVNAGDVITYQFGVENCGDVVLHGGVQVFDPMINPNGDHKIWSKTVYPGEVYNFERSYITSVDDCGEVENTATAIGHPLYPDGTALPNVVDEDTWTVDVICDDRASLGDRVWYDENENGIQDFGEDGVEGVTVNLYDCSDNPITSTTTDSDGYYLFDNLTPGDYYVEFILPAGYEFSPQNVGSNDTIDSDADESNGKTICTTLAPYENDLTWDAGIYMPEDEHNDLTIEKTASNLNPDDEEVIFYTITVTNNGPSDATNVEVTDILQSGLNYQYSDPADYNPTTGIWSVGNIASGNSKSINIYVQVDYQSLSLTPSFDLGIAADYNLFVLKDVNQPSSDTQGKMAVGRNATLSYYSVGDQLPPSGGTEDVLIVGRNLIFTSGAVYGGNVVYGNSIDMPQYGVSVVDGTVRQENPVPIDFGQAQNDLIALSNELAG
ncbi:MAG: choice-of-anchor A family protein, partial [Melioribacteraceae bacterium]|nr:choice-of-anchor A family protein [Melioribacteraceae bacterium]